jgi:hypothetical protein
MTAFWDTAPCSLVEVDPYVAEGCHLHTRRRENMKSHILSFAVTSRYAVLVASIRQIFCVFHHLFVSKRSFNFYEIKQCFFFINLKRRFIPEVK